MGDERVEARLRNGPLDHHRSARWNHNRLIADGMIGRIAVDVDIAEDGADDMEGRNLRRPGVDDGQADEPPGFGREWRVFVLVGIAIEDYVVRNSIAHVHQEHCDKNHTSGTAGPCCCSSRADAKKVRFASSMLAWTSAALVISA